MAGDINGGDSGAGTVDFYSDLMTTSLKEMRQMQYETQMFNLEKSEIDNRAAMSKATTDTFKSLSEDMKR